MKRKFYTVSQKIEAINKAQAKLNEFIAISPNEKREQIYQVKPKMSNEELALGVIKFLFPNIK